MALGQTFRVAIYDEFLDSFARIPRDQQKKVNKFLRLFRADPTAASINYESIGSFRDPNLRTVRIDQAWRAIVLKPERGNVYVMLWVDHHDKAMDWAARKRFEIHPETGALQVLVSETVSAPSESVETVPDGPPPLYDGVRDRELLRLGVPEHMIEAVRGVLTEAGLDELQTDLPAEAYEALFFLAMGESLEEVERAMAVSAPPEGVDTADFAAALERPDSQRRFAFVQDDDALKAMLDAPLEKWRVFLHPSQRSLVDRDWNGPVRVLGGAGTGKTVVAMHRAVYLAEKVFTQPDDRLLFTTFTRNLALDIRANLRALATPETLRRIEVVHIDQWVAELLRKAGYSYRIAYWNRQSPLRKLWSEALNQRAGAWSDAFYRDEWTYVVLAQGCQSWDDYKAAHRTGRGVRLSRQQRKEVWPVFETYRSLMERAGLRESEDALRDAATLLRRGEASVAYRAALVDEAQDMGTAAFELLRAAIPEGRNDLFIVGDGHQRIYGRKVVLGRAGVNIIGRGRRLRINYRTTDEIRRYAVALLAGMPADDLDGNLDNHDGYKSLVHGEPPEVRVHPSFTAEVDALAGWIRRGEANRTCVVARTKADRDRYADELKKHGFDIYELQRAEAEDRSADGVRVATMHRVKGLEFDRVALVGVTPWSVPHQGAVAQASDDAARTEVEDQERALLYVAATRARRAVLVSAAGEMSPWAGVG